ncbi:MAG: hypothetical protein ACOCQD_00870 [archaeon]
MNHKKLLEIKNLCQELNQKVRKQYTKIDYNEETKELLEALNNLDSACITVERTLDKLNIKDIQIEDQFLNKVYEYKDIDDEDEIVPRFGAF